MPEVETTNKVPTSVLKKLVKVQKDVGYMAKEGRNASQGYNYLSEAQISEEFKALLEKHGLFFYCSSDITNVQPSPSGKQIITDVRVRYRFIDTATGEYIAGVSAGQGSDATDKGVYKAITGAIKYIFMKTFLIPTGDDPENDGKKSMGNIRGTSKKYPSEEMGTPFEEED